MRKLFSLRRAWFGLRPWYRLCVRCEATAPPRRQK